MYGRRRYRPRRPYRNFSNSRKTYRKRYGKRYMRYKTNSRASRTINRGPFVVPDTTLCKLVYCDDFTMTSTTGIAAYNFMSGNALYDPDITNTGIQPTGLDQWAQFYNFYSVYGSSIEVTVVNTTGTTAATQNIKFVLFPVSSNVDITLIDANTEVAQFYSYPYSMYRSGNIVGGAACFRMKKYMSTAKVDGVPKIKVAVDDNYTGILPVTALNQGSSPLNNWRWVLGLQASDDTATVSVRVTARIVYYARLFDRKVIGGS